MDNLQETVPSLGYYKADADSRTGSLIMSPWASLNYEEYNWQYLW
jgi:hypothetical protein